MKLEQVDLAEYSNKKSTKESNEERSVEEKKELAVYRISGDTLIEKQRDDEFCRYTAEDLSRNRNRYLDFAEDLSRNRDSWWTSRRPMPRSSSEGTAEKPGEEEKPTATYFQIIKRYARENIQSMKNKELEVELFMDNANNDILCITKYWLRNGQLFFGFPNHQVASSFSRDNSLHGGSLIEIRNNLKFKEITAIVDLSAERVVAIACVELERLIVMSVHRPPHSSYELFESIMDRTL
ncbi:hypothetical protein EVAR_90963_1 [Eumeta japonica]|uniref:Uncharacterized protein n=1 Tax=Eumeta variegata TaxID=151549 RepID=A0A4C1Z5Y8_EUMVA|nr:hypothetical protein EVAR_90963_1 [Eumeta japonica]